MLKTTKPLHRENSFYVKLVSRFWEGLLNEKKSSEIAGKFKIKLLIK
jgi:hypothetical protein